MQYEGTHVTIRITTRALNCLFVLEDEKAVKPRARFSARGGVAGSPTGAFGRRVSEYSPPRATSRDRPPSLIVDSFARTKRQLRRRAKKRTGDRANILLEASRRGTAPRARAPTLTTRARAPCTRRVRRWWISTTTTTTSARCMRWR